MQMQAGVAVEKITPWKSTWLAGYAARDHAAEEIYQNLYAKALAITDGSRRAVLITTDLIGFDQPLANTIIAGVCARTGLPPEAVLLTASHTHTGPVVRGSDPLEGPRVDPEYRAFLCERIAVLCAAALANRTPVTLTLASGASDVGINRRRRLPSGEMAMLPNPDGVYDPEVQVLRAVDSAGKVRAVVLNYACHPTTIRDYRIGGDYVGYAQAYLEARVPGAVALFVQGCGANVKVRCLTPDGNFAAGSPDNARELGERLGQEALRVLNETPGETLQGPLRRACAEIALPLAAPPTREQAQAALNAADPWRQRWATAMLAAMDAGIALPESVPMAVQTLQLGQNALVALGGEVCVEIGLEIKRRLAAAGRRGLVAAYAHGLAGYIAPAALFSEGGYEVDGSYIYALRPAPYRPEVEELIYREVERQLSLNG